MNEAKLGNPAVVGLGGFGMTTLILQFHNLGWVGIGPVLWLGLVFGGSAQLVAGLLEFKTGNNFGFCAFSGYGAFWISLCFYLIFGTNAELIKAYPVLKLTGPDLGWFLVVWTIFTGILFIASMKHHSTLALIFLTLLLGFILGSHRLRSAGLVSHGPCGLCRSRYQSARRQTMDQERQLTSWLRFSISI